MKAALVPVVAAALIATTTLAGAALAQRAGPSESPAANRVALQEALAASRAAAARSERLEQEAARAHNAAERTAREAAALAARVQEAEAGIAAAEVRYAMAARELAALREEFGRQQQPMVHLTAALQQFARRPAALSVLRPGSVRDVVYVRAMLDGAIPQIHQRTAGLRLRMTRSRELREEAMAAAQALRSEEAGLVERRQELATREASQRLAMREAGVIAAREAERALALAEQARDLDGLIAELDRAGSLRERLAALPGPVLRPARPDEARLDNAGAQPVTEEAAASPPAPYLLPVTGRIMAGFGARQGAAASTGLTLAPRPGAQVVAPASGRVAFAGPYRGYGRIVIIEHRGGWTSLVTGLARTDAQVGAELVAGAPLGIAAQVDPAVTVELRRDGEPVNPLRFVG